MKILVLFTFDISLKDWQDQGLLDRELLIYKMLRKKGYKIGLLTYGDNTDLEFKDTLEGIEVFPVYSYLKRPKNKIKRLFQSFAIPFKLAAIFKEYDIYKTNQMLGAWVGVVAKLLYRKRLIVRCGYEWLRNSFREADILKKIFVALFGYPLELLVYSAADKTTVSSSSIARFVRRTFMQPAHKIVTVSNFVDVENFRRMDTDEFHDDRLLYIGRLNRIKNLSNLFGALKASRYRIGLDVIGNGGDFERLKEIAEQEKLDVQFLGTVPNSQLPVYINRYPVFALVSYFENNPKVLLEAMSCERMVIGSRVEGIRDLIDDRASGILVSTDTDGIRKGLEEAFSLSDDERRTLGRRARESVAKDSSLDEIFTKEEALYKELKS